MDEVAISGSAGRHGPTSLEGLAQGLQAFRQELQLYPEGHPRLEARLNALLGHVEQMQTGADGVVALELGSEGLVIDGVELPSTSPAAVRLRGALRERMIRGVRVQRGLARDELRALIDLLVQPPRVVCEEAGQSVRLGPHLEIAYLDQGFGEEGDCEGSAGSGTGGGDDELPENWQQTEWSRFPPEQLRVIQKVLTRPSVQSRVQELVPQIAGSGREAVTGDGADGQVNFAARFFSVLARDARVDWKNVTGLESMVLTGLDLLQEAHTQRQQEGMMAAKLLSADQAGELSTQLRWRLLRSFFSTQESRSPRPSEELAFQGTPSDQWTVREILEISTTTAPEELREALWNQFRAPDLADEYAGVLAHLVGAYGVQPDAELASASAGALQGLLGGGEVDWPLATLDALPARAAGLPAPLDAAWLEVLTCCVAPTDLLAVVAPDPQVRAALLETPQRAVAADEPAALSSARQHLGVYLRRTDRRPLELVRSVLTTPDLAPSAAVAWAQVMRERLGQHPQLGPWLSEHQDDLLVPPMDGILACLPPPTCARLLGQLPTATCETLLGSWVGRAELPAHLDTLLAAGGPLRGLAIRTLGKQRDPASFQQLRELLLTFQSGRSDLAEAEIVCQALARRGKDGGHALLEKVQEEKKWGLVHQWPSELRRLARRAVMLREAGT